MLLDVVFVRHGLSCANVLAKVPFGAHFLYPDPELTKQGILMSKSLSATLVKNVYTIWGDEPFSVCASQMIRAQQTAFYMMASSIGVPINVLPHVAEKGITRDNYALPQAEQIHIMTDTDPAIVDLLLKGKDGRKAQGMFDKSDFKKFLAWAVDNPKYFSKGSDGVFRAVIFSHGHFLKEVFRLNFNVKNNEAIHAKIDTDKPDSIGNRFEYWPVNKDFDLADCPNDCRFSYCNTTK
jgi:broad specificity phosphatase PhoE